jgi:beta-galactosidase
VCLAAAAPAQQRPDRYRTFLFGVDYYPEHWPEEYWEQDAKRMQECGVNVVRVAEFAWALMEPREGTYDFSLFDRAIAVLAKHGVKVILGTPTATPPKWLTSAYPEVLHVFPNGRPADPQSRRYACYNSPVYRKLSARIVEAMAAHYRDNPNVVGWQIDNEMNNENKECHSDSCRAAFRKWAQAKYGSLDALNERWGNRFWSQWYSAWDQLDLPFQTPSFHNPALILDYKRFISDSATSYLEDQVAIIRKHRPDDFITHNGIFKDIDYYRFTRNLDIYSHSNYPTFMDEPRFPTAAALTTLRGFNGRMMIIEQLIGPAGQTYLLRTPQPGQVNLWAWQAVAHGADGMVHFRWRGARRGAEEYWFGVLDQDNVPRARFQTFKKEGLEIQKAGPEILGSRVVSDIAVIKDFDDEWVYDHQYFTSEVSVGSAYVALVRAASELRHNVDVVGPGADFSRYKIVFAPYKIIMDPELAAKARSFVEGGGVFVVSAHTAVKDRDNAMTDKTIPILLTDLFGVELDSFMCYQPPSREKNAVRFEDGTAVPVNVFADVLTAKTAKAVGAWDRDYMKGAAACTENAVGKGKAVYYGSFFNVDSARYLIRRYANERGLKPIFENFPPEVEVTRRTKGSANFYFILNHSGEQVTVEPGAGYFDLLAGREAPATITLGPYGYVILKR